ncbi:hypothetical protein AOB46_17060 [Chryseobacterium indologenes]|uniref:Carboxypeptidase-like regulatory domain-containing protein n=2 Tax=Chryseobacterium indologenes TaxID=253 RepID=A0A0N0IUY8_CHRID|nr:hypothetical protein AOB46_17060 [Chryseobacterium indologenes]
MYSKYCLSGTLVLLSAVVFSQQKVTGKVTDNSNANINPVLVINISNQKSVLSSTSGDFTIDASEADEIRFVKEGYYRFDKKVSKEDFNTPLYISLKRMEIEIPEVKITYTPTGNLEKDSKYLSESGRVAALKSGLGEYMRSPLNEPLPDNSISSNFKGHDFKAGYVNVFGVLKVAANFIKKSRKPKITKANFTETQDFIRRIKTDIDLGFLRKYGMEDEQIDRFLIYANGTRTMAKKYRKDFKKDVIVMELQIAFAEYSKLNKLDSQ